MTLRLCMALASRTSVTAASTTVSLSDAVLVSSLKASALISFSDVSSVNLPVGFLRVAASVRFTLLIPLDTR